MRWVESVDTWSTNFGVDTFVEVGPGTVLAGLIRRIVPGVRVGGWPTPISWQLLADAGGG